MSTLPQFVHTYSKDDDALNNNQQKDKLLYQLICFGKNKQLAITFP